MSGINDKSLGRYERLEYKAPIHARAALSKALRVSEDVLRSEPTDIARWPGEKEKSGLPKLGFSHLWTEHPARSDETVGNENRRAYRESQENPKKCAHCDTKLSAYNKANYCYNHVSPDSRRVAS